MINPPENWRDTFAELESAEQYCEFFVIDFDPNVLARNRLAVLQGFHNLLPADWGTLDYLQLRNLFCLAYSSMTHSSAREEQLFKVFKKPVYCIPISAIGGRKKEATCQS